MSVDAEKVLEETIQDHTKGDVVFFWVRLEVDGRNTGGNDGLTFWSMCDIFNGGHCRYCNLFIWMESILHMHIVQLSCLN